MTDLKSPEHPLELLPAMLNLVLIQTGKLLRDPDCRGPKAIGLTKSKVNEFVPAANGRFHDALDEIEIKILDAKAVIERDLSVIRKKRAAREGVKIPSAAPSPIEVIAENNERQPGNTIADSNGFDLTMTDAQADATQLQNPGDEMQPQGTGQALGQEAVVAEQIMPEGTTETTGLAISLQPEMKPDEKDVSNTADDLTREVGSKMEDIMASNEEFNQHAESSGMEFDFDSMFNDADLTAVDGSMSFDLDFPSVEPDANAGHDLLADNAFENVAMTGTNATNGAPSTNEDITGLLDDVFNQAGDTANGNVNSATALPTTTKATEDTSQLPTQPATSDLAPSQLDDLFGDDTFDLGGTDEGIDGDGTLADFDFDEEWLKM